MGKKNGHFDLIKREETAIYIKIRRKKNDSLWKMKKKKGVIRKFLCGEKKRSGYGMRQARRR